MGTNACSHGLRHCVLYYMWMLQCKVHGGELLENKENKGRQFYTKGKTREASCTQKGKQGNTVLHKRENKGRHKRDHLLASNSLLLLLQCGSRLCRAGPRRQWDNKVRLLRAASLLRY